jgi:hypothetical protein
MNEELLLNEDKTFIIDNIYCKYHISDLTKPLVITFASKNAYLTLSQVEMDESPWGFSFVKKEGLNVISFACINSDSWYRSQKFMIFLELFSKRLSIFPERLGYGGSMGGYGVSAYANVLNMNRILLLNPISTLNELLVPFETRFVKSRQELDWKYGCIDGAKANSKGYIVYDPIYSLDKQHADRYKKNLSHLKVPGVGHSMPKHLLDLGILKWLFKNFVMNTLKIEEFHQKVRKRRLLPQYYEWMCSKHNRHITDLRKKIILKYKKINIDNNSSSIFFKKRQINALRDAAVELENVDIFTAYELTKIASHLRPADLYFTKKIRIYKKIINEKKIQDNKI